MNFTPILVLGDDKIIIRDTAFVHDSQADAVRHGEDFRIKRVMPYNAAALLAPSAIDLYVGATGAIFNREVLSMGMNGSTRGALKQGVIVASDALNFSAELWIAKVVGENESFKIIKP